ncbi:MAG: hypothetical protein JXM70_12605 [Pirellulales bacterium]|nr:hypothetical protein [Pirellulales bacterium]
MKTAHRPLISLIILAGLQVVAMGTELANDRLSLKLESAREPASLIQNAAWLPRQHPVFRGVADKADMQAWLSKNLPITAPDSLGSWKVCGDAFFERASSFVRYDGLLLTRHVELAKQGSNGGNTTRSFLARDRDTER